MPKKSKKVIRLVTIRPKLDSRLSFALSLSLEDLKKRKVYEDEQLTEVIKQIREIERQGKEQAKPTPKKEEPYSKLFTPLFHGIYLPGKKKPEGPGKLTVPYVSVFIRFHGSKKDLEELGIKNRSQAGNIFTAFVPLKLIPKLEAMPAVDYIELARPLFPTLDEAVSIAQIDILHSRVPPFNGQGVIVGIPDSVIDIYHPNFRNNDGAGTDGQGSTRVLRLWVQNLSPKVGETSPASFGYGVEYTQTNINAELNHAAETQAYQTVRHGGTADEHGTHVAGIAAGNGRAIGNAGEAAGTFIGAAPNAGIIFVAREWVYDVNPLSDSAFVADACSYIFTQAAALGMPCVINISDSDDQGPHDGSSLGQQFLDNLLNNPGRAITISAGNSNDTNSHASGQVAQGATQNLVISYLPNAKRSDVIEIWYDGHDRFSVTITAPTAPATVVGPVPAGGSTNAALPGGQQIQVNSILNDLRNGDNLISIIITANNANPIPTGNWTIVITGNTVINGRFQAWVDRNNRAQSDFQAPHLTANQMTLGDLATTKRAITVGNHQKPAPGNIAGNSGCGPTRDGRVKPELTAVGGVAGNSVTSCRSRNMNSSTPGNFYWNMYGTSMSAPLVAGAVALLFQCRGATQTWADIKQVLEDTADITASGGVLAIPHNAFGFGRLRMANACAQPAPNVDVWLREYVGDLGPEPATSVSWASPDIEILNQNHNPIPNPIHGTDAAGNPIDNFVRVTVRNRGTQIARNTEVYLYWADPATNLPFPAAWDSGGIFAPVGAPPQWVNQTNKIVIPVINPSANVPVEFRWLPPAPGNNIRGDNHFCLLVRLENQEDNSQIGTGGWALFAADNNIAIRNVQVQTPQPGGDADFSFYVMGSEGQDGLWIETDLPEAELIIQLPALSIPFRDMKLINKIGCPIPPYPGHPCFKDPFKERLGIKKPEVETLTGIKGASGIEFNKGIAKVKAVGNKVLYLQEIRIAKDAKMPVKITVRKVQFRENVHRVTITQFSDGRRIGGVVLELRKKK